MAVSDHKCQMNFQTMESYPVDAKVKVLFSHTYQIN